MFAHIRDQPFQHAAPWQEDFLLDHADQRRIKEDGQALFAPPGAGVEPTEKTNVFLVVPIVVQEACSQE
jgi:hypothetical protein